MPRPSKRTPEREARLYEALRAGNTRKASSAYAGIDQSTLEAWMHRFPDFADAIVKAEADAEIRNVAIIQKAASDTWQAAAWWLERRRSADYRQKQELLGADGGAVQIRVRFEDKEPEVAE
jgi:transposase